MLIWKTCSKKETQLSLLKKKKGEKIDSEEEMAERTIKETRFLCHFHILRVERICA